MSWDQEDAVIKILKYEEKINKLMRLRDLLISYLVYNLKQKSHQ